MKRVFSALALVSVFTQIKTSLVELKSYGEHLFFLARLKEQLGPSPAGGYPPSPIFIVDDHLLTPSESAMFAEAKRRGLAVVGTVDNVFARQSTSANGKFYRDAANDELAGWTPGNKTASSMSDAADAASVDAAVNRMVNDYQMRTHGGGLATPTIPTGQPVVPPVDMDRVKENVGAAAEWIQDKVAAGAEAVKETAHDVAESPYTEGMAGGARDIADGVKTVVSNLYSGAKEAGRTTLDAAEDSAAEASDWFARHADDLWHRSRGNVDEATPKLADHFQRLIVHVTLKDDGINPVRTVQSVSSQFDALIAAYNPDAHGPIYGYVTRAMDPDRVWSPEYHEVF